MAFPTITLAEWRAQVEKELAGKSFEKSLVHASLEGIAIAPLYTDAPTLPRVTSDGTPFRICMRHDSNATREEIAEDLEGGADGLWIARETANALPDRIDSHVLVVKDIDDVSCDVAGRSIALVSTLADHDRGADASEEVAIALSMLASRIDEGAREILLRVAVGRDTFIELAKIRALRLCVAKIIAAYGDSITTRVHAVCSRRTLAARDPWVNMLRVTTQTFSAVLGGADFVTPEPFDRELTNTSSLGRRVARNTGHVLREESALGRVIDPAAGSYYFDSLTDVLARDAWRRFQTIEKSEARIEATRATRRDQIAKRKFPILGVSEFANLDEALPSAPRVDDESRDAAGFEALRAMTDAHPREVLLVALGSSAESRARVAFATNLFAAGGLRARVVNAPEKAAIVCVCGSDAEYESDGATTVRALRDLGCERVLLAGRPNAQAVDAFIFLGCDALAILNSLVRA